MLPTAIIKGFLNNPPDQIVRRFFPLSVLAALVAGLGALSGGAPPACAQGHCIAAMVNDLPITAFEVTQRARFALLVSRQPDTPENREKMGRQVLRLMIDERLQLDDAKRNGISISNNEITDRIQQLEQSNNMPPGGAKALLGGAGIPFSVLTDFLRAGVAWTKLAQRRIRVGVIVTDPEIDEALRQIRTNVGKTENHVAEIFLAVDRPDQADEALRTARRIVEQLRAGAPFPAMVQQYSSGTSAATGGDLGWLLPGTVDPSLDAAIARLAVNQVSDPIRTQAGWHILKLIEQRPYGRASSAATIRFNMVQLLLPLPVNSSPDEVERQKGIAQGIISQSKSCADLRRVCGRTKGCTTSDSENVAASQLPPAIAEAARGATIGQGLGPYHVGNVIQLVAVCSREGEGGLPSRDSIERSIFVTKIEAAARRYMRDIRRNAVIDIRNSCKI
jgi:peptidyl-prolyl cis-trans isomerase SurA